MTPQLDNEALSNLGFQIIFYPSTILRASLFAAQRALEELKVRQTTQHITDQMVTFSEINALVGIDEIRRLEDQFVWSKERSES